MPVASASGRPQRVLLFIHSLHGGGAERVAADLSAHWAGMGREVMVVTQAGAEGDVYTLHPKVRREVLHTAGEGGGLRGIWSNVQRVRALRRVIKAFRPDIVLGMMTTASVLSVLACAGLSCRVIATEHTHPPSQTLSGFWQRLRRLTYPRAARVVALTRGTAQWLEQHVPGSRLAVIPNPVHWPLPKGEPALAPPSGDGRKRLLAVGRLHADKGFDLLLRAYARLAPSHPDWDLVILGEGDERRALETQVREAGLQERVSLPGRAGNVGDWYQSADLYVLTSRFEGLSNTLLESMASGLAAVAFDCDTGPREIVREGVDGVLVRPNGDVDALCRELDAVMGDEAARRRMAQAATAVRERFSAERVLGLWEELFDGVRGSGR
ncbi:MULTISPECIES: glycosyltransferase family 4 protein [Achromobacter]|jgi:glycosyltransferase involved in cell wall biosynthesis|uniref:GalNAc-alpha-(1->4)-GalNAc-alpha-(1->3)-diNAcBac-PP-undecaprenol alpha-1,4-N-acetyl-D-galactosaminyltransferase n=2 Tax=Achromobacter TaxID=222 RepID=A0A2M9H3C6_9BURK|nr:glycosyltransferase family 4 protein [Achromobacter ruhlandii]ALX86110.1 glycosyl transferase [Achromobacter denitrificans]OCZ64285.1 glycosyl transferase [Achromobacter xylosoxidans]MCI1835458.1 glycosyltransferase family 4 protein [Achromobacter ruhlandii]MEB6660008.1 glycosyltransferase family 4 protein [Achromobacter ruhlandii]OCZ67979.1 glycosyl transferase [Achromobacter xylosoxidans]